MSAVDAPDPTLAETEADRRIALDPRDAVAMLAKADHRMRDGDHRAANAYYVQTIRLAGMGSSLAADETLRAQAAIDWLAQRFREAIIDGLANEGVTRGQMHPRFARSLSIMFGEVQRDPTGQRYPQLPNMYFYPDLSQVEFADRATLDWAEVVEAASRKILEEAQTLLAESNDFGPYVKRNRQRPQGDVHGMLEDASWSTLDLTDKGQPMPERIALAPFAWETITNAAPLCDIPARAPSLMYSLLRSGSRIPPHTGMINTRYICHLPLIVPGNGAIRVGSQTRPWQFGELLVFDDTIEHEAWNDSSDDRLVLIFDVWRPEISDEERHQIRALFRAVDAY